MLSVGDYIAMPLTLVHIVIVGVWVSLSATGGGGHFEARAIELGQFVVVTSSMGDCPCDFDVIVPADAPALLLSAVRKPGASVQLRHLSIPSQTAHDAVSHGAELRHHHIHIPHFGRYALAVRLVEGRQTAVSAFVKAITAHVSIFTLQRERCPVYLPQHPPDRASFTHRVASRPRGRLARKEKGALRVIGGENASAELARYLVSVLAQTSNKVFICSGTLVSSTIVVTAAHCVNQGKITVHIGGTEALPPNGEARQIIGITIHPSFTPDLEFTIHYDIAWIQLSSPAPESARIMKVNINSSIPLPDSVVRHAGYGTVIPNNTASNPKFRLNQVDIPTVSPRQCSRSWQFNGPPIQRKYQICAGYYRGGCGSCNGDSGGPIFQYDESGDPILIGVASFADQCSYGKGPTVYVRVSAFVDNFLPEGLNKASETVPVFLSESQLEFGRDPGDDKIASPNGGLFSRVQSPAVIVVIVVAGIAIIVILAAGIPILSRRLRSAANTRNDNDSPPLGSALPPTDGVSSSPAIAPSLNGGINPLVTPIGSNPTQNIQRSGMVRDVPEAPLPRQPQHTNSVLPVSQHTEGTLQEVQPTPLHGPNYNLTGRSAMNSPSIAESPGITGGANPVVPMTSLQPAQAPSFDSNPFALASAYYPHETGHVDKGNATEPTTTQSLHNNHTDR